MSSPFLFQNFKGVLNLERIDVLIKSVVSVGGAATSYFFGGWSALLSILLTFVVIDYVTGVFASGLEGKLSSKVGLQGIAKKVFIFVMVAIGHLVDSAIGDSHFIRDTIIFFYLSNELLSIIENGGRLGAPIPPVIQQAVEVLKGKGKLHDPQN